MKITIQGQDYSAALDTAVPLTIERTLNKPSVCKLRLGPPVGATLQNPVRNQSLEVVGDDGTRYFTGYLAVSPLPKYMGLGVEGPRYLAEIEAVSDELLLDEAGTLTTKGAAGETAEALMSALIKRSGPLTMTLDATMNATISEFLPSPGDSWSTNAGEIADRARASYRAADGQVNLLDIPVTVHTLSEADNSLEPANVTFAQGTGRTLANDVTVCGEEEATAYVTEYFVGDGVSTQFNLASAPYCLPASRRLVIDEWFDGIAIDKRVWGALGSEGYLSLGASGLTMTGGGGLDGDAVLSWLDQIEMRGTLLLEATGVVLAPGSAGVLAGFFKGVQTHDGCIAGFQVAAQQGTGAVSIQPIVNGQTQGTSYLVDSANQYALRVRVHCNEMQRMLSIYRSCGEAGTIARGGQMIDVGGHLQFEIQEFVNGVAGMPVTLYDGAIASLPAIGIVVAASSANLYGSMRALNLTSLGSAWVTCTPANGNTFTRRMGTTAQAAECHVESSGRLEFYPGYAPPIGERIAVSYRTSGRAVGRRVNGVSQQALTQAGLPPVASWIGSVTNPAARSSHDCRNVAEALVAAASSANALWRGTYKATNFTFTSDVWPGDALQVNAPSASLNTQLVVRSTKMSYRAILPDLVEYTVSFANEWAEDLAIKTSAAVPADTCLPAIAGATPSPNLNALTVVSMNADTVTL